MALTKFANGTLKFGTNRTSTDSGLQARQNTSNSMTTRLARSSASTRLPSRRSCDGRIRMDQGNTRLLCAKRRADRLHRDSRLRRHGRLPRRAWPAAKQCSLPAPRQSSTDCRNVLSTIRSSKWPNLPVLVTEWGPSYSPRDPVHDSYFCAAWILNRLRQLPSGVEAMSYWTFSDQFEESGFLTNRFMEASAC